MNEKSLLEKLKAGSGLKKDIDWPGSEEKIQIRLLNDGDYMAATLAADELFKNISIANIEKYNSEIETQLLYRCCLDPVTGKSIGSITDFRMTMTPEIKAVLVQEMNAFHDENSPDVTKMSQVEFDKLYDSVKKNAETTVTSVSNIHLLKKLIIILAKQLTI